MQKSSWWTYKQLIMDWKVKGWTSLNWAMIWGASATFLQTARLLLLSHIIFLPFVISPSSPPIINTNHLSPHSPLLGLNESRHAKLTSRAKVIKAAALKQKAEWWESFGENERNVHGKKGKQSERWVPPQWLCWWEMCCTRGSCIIGFPTDVCMTWHKRLEGFGFSLSHSPKKSQK